MLTRLPALAAAALLIGAPTRATVLAFADAPAVGTQIAVTDTVTLRIEGMTCGGCTLATRKVLERLDGVLKADVSYEEKRAVVTYDAKKVTIAQMITAVATLKYTATVFTPTTTPTPSPAGKP
jgi:copper chaperone CopZ